MHGEKFMYAIEKFFFFEKLPRKKIISKHREAFLLMDYSGPDLDSLDRASCDDTYIRPRHMKRGNKNTCITCQGG